MSKYECERKLRSLLRREPFEPFVIELNDGRTIFVDQPSVAFGGGRAGFIGPDELVDFFDFENIVGFHPGTEQAVR